MNSIISFFMAIIAFFTSIFGASTSSKKLDLDKFELVWSDEFDGSEIDTTKWLLSNSTTVRRGGYWNSSLAQVKDGNLIIYTKYLENGVNEGDPSGWYSAGISTQGLFEQTYGYFEIRCILPKGLGQWSAFWMLNDDAMSNAYPDGSNGGEIDIFEAPYYGYTLSNKYEGAVHWGGYGSEHKSVGVVTNSLGVNIYNTYNTYGIEWNENSYTYYFNGKKVATVDKSQALPSQKSEYLLLTVEIGGTNGVPAQYWAKGTIDDNGKDFVSEFKIDYVRAYQYK